MKTKIIILMCLIIGTCIYYQANNEEKTFATSTVSTTVTPVKPIKLLEFTAEACNEGVNLLWSVEGKPSKELFTIEKSNDSIHFTPIEEVRASKFTDYSILDKKPISGTAYYRLRQDDGDVKVYSSIVSVYFQALTNLGVYRNYSDNTFSIQFEAKIQDNYSIEVFNSSGQLVFTKDLFNFVGHYNERFDILQFGKSVYTINVKRTPSSRTVRIIAY